MTSSRANANDSHTFTCVGEILTTLTDARTFSGELNSSVSIAFFFISPFSLKQFFVMDSYLQSLSPAPIEADMANNMPESPSGDKTLLQGSKIAYSSLPFVYSTSSL